MDDEGEFVITGTDQFVAGPVADVDRLACGHADLVEHRVVHRGVGLHHANVARPDERVDEILGQLNAHIDLFKDELREDIAQEWCAQENWRRYPYKPGPFNDPKISIYGVLYDANPILDGLDEVMDYLLPKGYDDETPATDLI